MKLKKLKLYNYRRFIGEVEINFASEAQKNVTIIRAENGAGKTGIMTALLFGLFGETDYNQFNISSDTDDIIINRKVLKEKGNAHSTVTIEFIDDNKNYKIERIIEGTSISDTLHQDSDSIKSKMWENGLIISEDTDEINKDMNNRIGEHIRGFLFFDGVKYVNLFQRDYKQYKKELQKIIEKLLNIKDLDETINQISSIESKYSSNNSNSRYAKQITKVMNSLEEQNQNLKDKNNELEEAEESLRIVEKDEIKLNNQLKQFETYRSKFEEIKAIQSALGEGKSTLNEVKSDIVTNLDNAYRELFRNTIGIELRDELQTILSNENTISKSLINTIIKSKVCICGSEINDDEVRELKLLLESVEDGDRTDIDYIAEIRKIYDELSESEPGYQTYFSEKWTDMNDIVQKIEELNKKNENIDISINDLLEKQGEISNTRGEISTRKRILNEDIEELNNDIKVIEEDIIELGESLEEFQRLQAMEQGELDKYRFFSTTRKKLKQLRDNYLKDAQKNISKKSNEFFNKLLSEDDKNAIKELKINKDYRIQAFDNNGDEIFPQLSAGQKHLAAMAFTMGLTAVSTDAKPDYHFPLVMDTPLSNLDLANRKRLIKLMPTVVNQWILTPMDTEMTRNEITFFIETDSVGKVYELLKKEDESELKEHNKLIELVGGNM